MVDEVKLKMGKDKRMAAKARYLTGEPMEIYMRSHVYLLLTCCCCRYDYGRFFSFVSELLKQSSSLLDKP